jgi:hypothetical protein
MSDLGDGYRCSACNQRHDGNHDCPNDPDCRLIECQYCDAVHESAEEHEEHVERMHYAEMRRNSDGIDRWRKARKKPVVVEFRGPYTDTEIVETIEGDFEVNEEYINEHGGYVIIRGVEGEVYPCGLDIFRETYERAAHDCSVGAGTNQGGR